MINRIEELGEMKLDSVGTKYRAEDNEIIFILTFVPKDKHTEAAKDIADRAMMKLLRSIGPHVETHFQNVWNIEELMGPVHGNAYFQVFSVMSENEPITRVIDGREWQTDLRYTKIIIAAAPVRGESGLEAEGIPETKFKELTIDRMNSLIELLNEGKPENPARKALKALIND